MSRRNISDVGFVVITIFITIVLIIFYVTDNDKPSTQSTNKTTTSMAIATSIDFKFSEATAIDDQLILPDQLDIKVEEVDRTPPVSRDHERDPLQAAIDYSQHMSTYKPPTPTPVSTPVPVATPSIFENASGDPTAEQWAELRNCESGGNYATNTGNGYSGAYQFLDSTWQAYGGTGSAYQASPAEQDMRALMLYHASGSGPWPVCGQYLN